MMPSSKATMTKLRWMSVGGGVLILLGLIATGANQAAGIIIALLGLAVLLSVGYVAYDIGKSEKSNT
ncbi:MAG: hypothetical protein ACLQEQ_07170 [Nitrososphaerales archaeon]